MASSTGSPLPTSPLGIFDSGVGGLTVARAIAEKLPGENFVYFGDTAHLPYGDKSAAAIKSYSERIGEHLWEQGCKALVIACNSASSVAYEALAQRFDGRMRVYNVIDPVVRQAALRFPNGQVGVIGTRATVQSGVYATRLLQAAPGMLVHTKATPLLAPMIEEGFLHNTVSQEVIKTYLNTPEFAHPEALILGCTHYPLIHQDFELLYNGRTEILDSPGIVAQELAEGLAKDGLINPKTSGGNYKFFVSDYTESFERIARQFFGKDLHLEERNLWETTPSA